MSKRKIKFQKKREEEEEEHSPINYTNTGSLVVNKFLRSGEKTSSSIRISPKGYLHKEKIDLKDYKLKKTLGVSSLNGGVELLENDKKEKIIVKTIKIDPTKAKEILSEIELLQSCDHPQIVCLKNAFLEEKRIKLILEYMDCGSLDKIIEFYFEHQKGQTLSEVYISKITRKILKGLDYLHNDRKTIHRDLKPHNILVDSQGHIKIADFGAAGIDQSEESNEKEIRKTFIGSEAYMSPERLLGDDYSFPSDVWSLGVIVGYMSFGQFPFNLKDNSETGNNMFGLLKLVKEPIKFDSEIASKELISFVSQCCILDPKKRENVKELLNHEFILKYKNEKEHSLKKFIRDDYLAKKRTTKSKSIELIDPKIFENLSLDK
eukprot:gene10288-2705_t